MDPTAADPTTTHASHAADPEVPFVCTGCTRVFRARLSALQGASIRCGSCGAQRSGDALLRLLPTYLRRGSARGA